MARKTLYGITVPNIESYTTYRVQHSHVCNSCCNDMCQRQEHKYGSKQGSVILAVGPEDVF